MVRSNRKRKPRRVGPADAVDQLLDRIRGGIACVPVERPGQPKAVLISLAEYERLEAIDKSPHAEIIGRLLFAPLV